MLRVIVCDDDLVFLNDIYEKAFSIFGEIGVRAKIHKYTDVEKISQQMLDSCDIALFDIDFDNAVSNGIALARKLRKTRKDSVIIFVTNFIEYAPEGYEVQAFRYILKGELQSELKPYLIQAVEQLQAYKETLKIQTNGEIIDIILEDILYMEVLQHNVTIHVKKDDAGKQLRKYTFYASLSDLEAQLEPQGFLRIHKSYLVNMRHLVKFQCREATLSNGLVLRVGEKSYSANKRKYLLWRGLK